MFRTVESTSLAEQAAAHARRRWTTSVSGRRPRAGLPMPLDTCVPDVEMVMDPPQRARLILSMRRHRLMIGRRFNSPTRLCGAADGRKRPALPESVVNPSRFYASAPPDGVPSVRVAESPAGDAFSRRSTWSSSTTWQSLHLVVRNTRNFRNGASGRGWFSKSSRHQVNTIVSHKATRYLALGVELTGSSIPKQGCLCQRAERGEWVVVAEGRDGDLVCDQAGVRDPTGRIWRLD